MKLRFYSGAALLLLLLSCSTTKLALTDDQVKAKIKQHISALASDAFEGRETGTHGEELAMNYIINEFKGMGLKPMGTSKYVQEFPFTEGATIGAGTQLYINAKSFKLNDDYFPLQYSGNGVALSYPFKVGYGIYAPSLNHDDYDGRTNLVKKIFVIESSTPDAS